MSQQDAQNTVMPEKMELTSLNIADHQKQKLKELFPEVFTEGNKIDFDQLKRTLGEMVDGGKERFGMQWAGKADCFKTIQQPSLATLVPCPEESIDFDTTENVFIEGDNLEVLKLLQKSYLGKVKMIYIDPPYNTGKDFIYPDNYSENLDTYLEYTGQIDGEGRKFSTNTDTDGRFHSKWMNMMYPRLFLAKNLLREDGVIFISIDDYEINNLRALSNEIFGEENLVGVFVREAIKGGSQSKFFRITHDYILVYARSINELSFSGYEKEEMELNLVDENGAYAKGRELNKWGAGSRREDSPSMWYPIYTPDGDEVYPIRNDGSEGRWRFGKTSMIKLINDGNVIFEKRANGAWIAYEKLRGNKTNIKQFISILKDQFLNAKATEELKDLFENNRAIFDFSKPSVLVKDLIILSGLDNNDIILDFFAGSATTAHAVMDLNKEDGGNRKFICVQLPEPTDEKSEAFKAGYNTIAEISKERIRLSAIKIQEDLKQSIAQAKRELMRLNAEVAKFPDDLLFTLDRKEEYEEAQAKVTAQEELIREKELLLEKLDLGFRVFKLQKSNFSVWDSSFTTDAEQIAFQLDQHVDHISPEAEQQAILFELLLKAGFELTTPIEMLTLADKTVYSIAEGALLICLEKQLTLEVMHAIADLEPSRVIVLDEGFQNNDQLKTNASLTLKSKGILDFRTV